MRWSKYGPVRWNSVNRPLMAHPRRYADRTRIETRGSASRLRRVFQIISSAKMIVLSSAASSESTGTTLGVPTASRVARNLGVRGPESAVIASALSLSWATTAAVICSFACGAGPGDHRHVARRGDGRQALHLEACRHVGRLQRVR